MGRKSIEQDWHRLTKRWLVGDQHWVYSRRPTRRDPLQGWKLHLSATILSAPKVLAAAKTVLRRRGALFKVPRKLEQLRLLNKGAAGFSQVGKFLTVYPRSPEEALFLARELHRATRGLEGAAIPFDERYRQGSLIFYRYGAFRASPGCPAGFLRSSNGRIIHDRSAPGRSKPHGFIDPFRRSPRTPKPTGPIGTQYFAYRAKMQRGKGGVYDAIDFSASPPRLVILKEGRRHGETDPQGMDGFARLRREGRVLRQLRAVGVGVPAVFREFSQNGSRYLLLERITGKSLLSLAQTHLAKSSWRRAQKVLEKIEPLLLQIHSAGWVWRDCKPQHIFTHNGAATLIDFEGACRIEDEGILPWGSPDYTPPIYRKKNALRQAGTLEDDYALGVIAFQFLAGEFPSLRALERARVYRRAGCPEALRARIERLLRGS